MRTSWIGVSMLCSLLGCQRTQTDDGVAFVHVNVVDAEHGRLLADQTVVVREHRILAAGPAAQVSAPRGARVVEGSGKYLMPGLWDNHTHLFGVYAPGSAAVTFPLLVANGVTNVREAGGFIDLQ